jgi:hypothetical protein
MRLNAKWLLRQPWFLGGVVSVDGTLLPIEKPEADAQDYWCRKDFYALNWLLAGDADLVVRYLYGAFPGSAQDSRAANRSDLFDRLRELEPFFAVGDNGFALRRYLQVPIKGHVSRVQRAYNHGLSSIRIDQEYGRLGLKELILLLLFFSFHFLFQRASFFCRLLHLRCINGHLKGRFKRFRYPNRRGDSEFYSKLFVACVCIHNVIRIHDLERGDDFELEYKRDQRAQKYDSKHDDLTDNISDQEERELGGQLGDGGLEAGKARRAQLFEAMVASWPGRKLPVNLQALPEYRQPL